MKFTFLATLSCTPLTFQLGAANPELPDQHNSLPSSDDAGAELQQGFIIQPFFPPYTLVDSLTSTHALSKRSVERCPLPPSRTRYCKGHGESRVCHDELPPKWKIIKCYRASRERICVCTMFEPKVRFCRHTEGVLQCRPKQPQGWTIKECNTQGNVKTCMIEKHQYCYSQTGTDRLTCFPGIPEKYRVTGCETRNAVRTCMILRTTYCYQHVEKGLLCHDGVPPGWHVTRCETVDGVHTCSITSKRVRYCEEGEQAGTVKNCKLEKPKGFVVTKCKMISSQETCLLVKIVDRYCYPKVSEDNASGLVCYKSLPPGWKKQRCDLDTETGLNTCLIQLDRYCFNNTIGKTICSTQLKKNWNVIQCDQVQDGVRRCMVEKIQYCHVGTKPSNTRKCIESIPSDGWKIVGKHSANGVTTNFIRKDVYCFEVDDAEHCQTSIPLDYKIFSCRKVIHGVRRCKVTRDKYCYLQDNTPICHPTLPPGWKIVTCKVNNGAHDCEIIKKTTKYCLEDGMCTKDKPLPQWKVVKCIVEDGQKICQCVLHDFKWCVKKDGEWKCQFGQPACPRD